MSSATMISTMVKPPCRWVLCRFEERYVMI
jgi:hypothetical protein